MKLKSDINLLKAAGGKQKIKSKTPLTLVLVLIAVVVIGFFGYTFYSQYKKTNELQSTIATAKNTINNKNKNAIMEETNAISAETKAINEAIDNAEKLEGFFDTVPAMFPHLTPKYETELYNAVRRADNSEINELKYNRATLEISVNASSANLEVDVVDVLLDSRLFRKVGYKCPVCQKVTYYTKTPAYVDCSFPDEHNDLPDVDVKPNEDGTYPCTFVCALKNIVDVCIERPILTNDEITVTRPQYSSSSASTSLTLTINASCEKKDYLKNYYDNLKNSGYFSQMDAYNPSFQNNEWSISVKCTTPSIAFTK